MGYPPLVEPHSFSDDYSQLTVYEPASNLVKTFKTQRVEDVELLGTPQTKLPTEVHNNPFDWPGKPVRVSLCLTAKAHRLLIEEHPLTQPDVTANPDNAHFPYTYTGEVRSWVGLGRFVLGIPGEVRVDEPEAFRDYLRGRIGAFEVLV